MRIRTGIRPTDWRDVGPASGHVSSGLHGIHLWGLSGADRGAEGHSFGHVPLGSDDRGFSGLIARNGAGRPRIGLDA